MPLSPPEKRRHVHTRNIECKGYLREDGLWDIEGNIKDTKTYNFNNEWRGEVKAGTPVHNMWLRLTVDDDYLVHQVQAVTDHSPFQICSDITPEFEKLKGLKIAKGFHRQVKERLGGKKGCTHLVELLGALSTVAFQTIHRHLKADSSAPGEAPDAHQIMMPFLLNSCHAWDEKGKVVQRFLPDFYSGEE